MTEMVAYSFLRIDTAPMVRKYAFHLVLAGHLFIKHTQVKLLNISFCALCFRGSAFFWDANYASFSLL